MIIACGGEAAGLRPSPALTRARLYEHQPRTEEKQRERDPPRKNQAGWPETGEQSGEAVPMALLSLGQVTCEVLREEVVFVSWIRRCIRTFLSPGDVTCD